jgi:hypothetical protein
MKAMLYLNQTDQPVSVLDDVQVVEYKTNNHPDQSHYRVFYKTKNLNATKMMAELHRDRRFLVKFDDGRSANALLQHSSLDMEGNAVGVLRILGSFA